MLRKFYLTADVSHRFLFSRQSFHISPLKESNSVRSGHAGGKEVWSSSSDSSIRKPRFQSTATTWQKWCGALSSWCKIVVFLRFQPLQCVRKQTVKHVAINVSSNGVFYRKRHKYPPHQMFTSAGTQKHWCCQSGPNTRHLRFYCIC